MAVSLKKGQKVDLKKSSGEVLDKILVGLGWDAIEQPKKGGFFGLFSKTVEIDCDASVIMCQNGKLMTYDDVVYHSNLEHESHAVRHMGDNRTGDGDGDDEVIEIELSRIPAAYDRLIFVVNIYEANERKQNFGMIQNAFIRIVDRSTNTEMCRYDLSGDYHTSTSMIFGEVYRVNGVWKFNAMGEGTSDSGLQSLIHRFQ